MKRFLFLALIALAVFAGFGRAPVSALSSTKASKVLTLTFLVTPSPIAYAPRRAAPRANVAALLADPYHTTLRVASANTFFDVPVIIAQSQGNIPVKFASQPDPSAAYLHFVPHTTTMNANYGSNSYTCPFEIYGYYSTTWHIVDFGYGTTSTASTGTFPIQNYPTASYLSWDIPSIGNNTFAAYANSGSPGQTTFTGVAGVSQQHCIDLQLVVPTSLPAGYYTAAIQYVLIAS